MAALRYLAGVLCESYVETIHACKHVPYRWG